MALNYLKNITAIGKNNLSLQLEINIIDYFRWGFLTVGGFTNVQIPQSGTFGGDQSRLRPAKNYEYTDGQVWEGFRQDWVWESGINFQYSNPINPINISGIKIDGTFYSSSTSGAYSHKIDYPNGRIIFDSPISPSSIVQCSYSFRNMSIDSSDSETFRQLMFGSFRIEDDRFLQSGSGNWALNPENRVQLPFIGIEVMNNRNWVGRALGGGEIEKRRIVFHIFGETAYDVKNLSDALVGQFQTRIDLYDSNNTTNKYLSYDGTINSGTRTYPELIQSDYWRNLYVTNSASKSAKGVAPLSRGLVNWDVDVYL